jgi:hypothetical protein
VDPMKAAHRIVDVEEQEDTHHRGDDRPVLSDSGTDIVLLIACIYSTGTSIRRYTYDRK